MSDSIQLDGETAISAIQAFIDRDTEFEETESSQEAQAALNFLSSYIVSLENKCEQASARIEAVEQVLTDHDDAYQRVISEKCAEDEMHCTCVPFLRGRIKELEEESIWHPESIRPPDNLIVLARLDCGLKYPVKWMPNVNHCGEGSWADQDNYIVGVISWRYMPKDPGEK